MVPSQAIRTTPPISDFGLVDFEALGIHRRETRRGADRALDVDDAAADAADQVVVVVAHPVLEPRR
jgi:hypothetical protein